MNHTNWHSRLTTRQVRILRRLRDEGVLTQEQLKVRGCGQEWEDTLQDLYFQQLADGWFHQSGTHPSDRYWGITDAGRKCLEDLKETER